MHRHRLFELLAVALFAALSGCRALNPPPLPEARCQKVCAARAPACSEDACERGCAFILDRLVEHETDHVVACVAGRKPACDDRVWAECAAAVGPHADGGPPAPPPREE